MSIFEIHEGTRDREAEELARAQAFDVRVRIAGKDLRQRWLQTPDALLSATPIQAVLITEPEAPDTLWEVSCFVSSGEDVHEYLIFSSSSSAASRVVYQKVVDALVNGPDAP